MVRRRSCAVSNHVASCSKRHKTHNKEDTHMIIKTTLSSAAVALLLASSALAQTPIKLGHLADYSGPTADVGTSFGQGVADAFAWVNKNGGVNGTKLDV